MRELDNEMYQPFYSRKAKFYRAKGNDEIGNEVLFPGYVFVESDIGSREFVISLLPVSKKCMYAHRVVNSDHGANCCDIKGSERERLLAFVGRHGNERTVEISEGYMEDDRVMVVDGSLKGMESSIRRIDKHKRTAIIEIVMFGEVKVGLEVVGKHID